jgi:hypothetical protein
MTDPQRLLRYICRRKWEQGRDCPEHAELLYDRLLPRIRAPQGSFSFITKSRQGRDWPQHVEHEEGKFKIGICRLAVHYWSKG